MENGEWRIGWRTPILNSPFSILNSQVVPAGLAEERIALNLYRAIHS
jgi:hypothetical protein